MKEEFVRRLVEGGTLPSVAESTGSDAFGDYTRLRLLGTGATGEVWEAYDPRLRRSVALKILKHREPGETARFRREAQAAAGLDHPSIAAVYEFGEVDGAPYIAMRLVRGTDLSRIPRDDSRLPVRLVRDAALALHFAHERGIVHRDVKPFNLLVEEGRVVVTDFGLAKRMDVASSLTASGHIMGTPAYMSPEQARGDLSAVGPRSDIYSLGATLYELVTGRTPFESRDLYQLLSKVMDGHPPSPRSINPKIDRGLETILLKCLEKEPRRRYSSARLLAEDLTRWFDGEPISARPPSSIRRWARGLVRRRWIVAAAALLVTLSALAIVVVPRWPKERTLRRERERDLAERRAKAEAANRIRAEALAHLEAARQLAGEFERSLADPHLSPESLQQIGNRAYAEYANAVKLFPALPEAHLGMARLLAINSEMDAALQELDRAIELSPDLATAYLDRIRILSEMLEHFSHSSERTLQNDTQAVDLSQRVAADQDRIRKLNRDRIELQYAEGLVAFSNAEYERAAQFLGEVLTDHPTDYRAREFRGHALKHLRRLSEAEEEFTRGIAYTAHRASLYYHRGWARNDLGRFREAGEDFARCIRLAPHKSGGYFGQASVSLALARYDDAIAHATEALQRDPRLSSAYAVRAKAHAEKKNWPAAIADYTETIRLYPRGVNAETAYFERGRCYSNLEKHGPAIADYTCGLEIRRDYPDGWLLRGIEYLLVRQAGLALADFTRAIELRPKWAMAY